MHEHVCKVMLAWFEGNVVMEGLSPMLDERGHQDVQAGAHMEGLHRCCCRCIQAHLHSRKVSL